MLGYEVHKEPTSEGCFVVRLVQNGPAGPHRTPLQSPHAADLLAGRVSVISKGFSEGKRQSIPSLTAFCFVVCGRASTSVRHPRPCLSHRLALLARPEHLWRSGGRIRLVIHEFHSSVVLFGRNIVRWAIEI